MYASLRKRVTEIYHLHKGRYGYRRIVLALKNEGVPINHKTVERLMREGGLKSLVRGEEVSFVSRNGGEDRSERVTA